MGRKTRGKAELVGTRACLPIVLKAAGFFRLVELFGHIFDLVTLFVDDGLHPLPLQGVVGGPGGGGSKEIFLLVEAIFVVAALLLRARFSIGNGGEVGGGLGCRLSLLLLLALTLLLGVEVVELFALLLDSSEFLFLIRHILLSGLLQFFLPLAFAAKILRRLTCLTRAFFFLYSHQRKDRRLAGRRRDGVGVWGSVAAGSSSSYVVPHRGLG